MSRTVLDRTKGGGGPPAGTGGRIRAFVRRHRRAAAIAGVVSVAFIVFMLVWFQPQKVFLNTTVNETIPGAVLPSDGRSTPGAGGGGSESNAPAAGQTVTLASGKFQSLEHGTSGTALILQLPDRSNILRFENLDTLNGPDLHVYLSELPAGDDAGAYGEGFIDLGKLKGNKGSQNYDIPAGTDLSKYRSVVIWCKRFTVGFGVAPLES